MTLNLPDSMNIWKHSGETTEVKDLGRIGNLAVNIMEYREGG